MYNNEFLQQSELLYPNGRAFNMPKGDSFHYVSEDGDTYIADTGEPYGDYVKGGVLYRLQAALSVSASKVFAALKNVTDSTIADNPNFTESDATAWERRLGIITRAGVSLADRMLAINQKYNYPGVNRYRQHYSFVQAQLNAAGFPVGIYENRFDDGMGGYISKSPAEVLGFPVGRARYGAFNYGLVDYNSTWGTYGITIIANYIEEEKDDVFSVTPNYKSTFFIAGVTIDTFVYIQESRKEEFRQLILQLKPLQAVGYMFVTYF